MLARKADGPLTVQIPGPPQDRPSWRAVGILAAVGFVAGIAWPRLVGVRPGPNLPETSSTPAAQSASAIPPGSAAASVPGSPPVDPRTPPGSASPPSAALAALPPSASGGSGAAATPISAGRVTVLSGPILSCKTDGGDSLKGADCGKLHGLDALIGPRLHKLAACPEAAAASGRLQVVLHLDFARGWLTADLGHTQTVASPDPLLACARADLAGVAIAGVGHDNPRYSVSYSVVFDAGEPASGTSAAPAPENASDSTPAPSRSAAEPADGTAQVVWEVAIVRDAPKTGKVLVRLQRGAQVRIGAVKDGWYPIRYGDGNAGEGWVYRGAIGK
jgi:Bacterial SH3 domain